MGRETLKEEYFSWLYKQIGKQRRSYVKLCKELHEKKFRWTIHNDDNRCEDGLALRDIFAEENNLDETHLEVKYFFKADCSVFELLVALAKRIDDLMYDLEHQENHASRWFREMLENLRLSRFTDDTFRDTFLDPVSEASVNEILEVFMDRQYGFDGRGGLFPLKKRPPEDQSEVEIWYQLMRYLDENYG